MSTYTLTINIDATSVQNIVQAGQYVTIVQAVSSYAQSTAAHAFVTTPPLAVAWLSFVPFQLNTITWSSSYSLFASNAAPANGATLQLVGTHSATPGMTYPFQNNIFGSPVSAGLSGYFTNNLQGTSMTFGLAVAATVNQVPQTLSPISATTLLTGQTGWFTPAVSVAVFLSTIAANGSVFYEFGTPQFYSMSSGSVSLQFQSSNSTFNPTI